MAIEVPLTNGKFAIVDDEDFEKVSVYKWRFDGRYATTVIDKESQRKVYMHRLITNAATGELIDHKNGDRLDNRKENLRIASFRENAANCRLHAHNTTGYKGVYRFSRGNKRWRASITFNDKQLSLGYYDNPIDAAKAYNAKALELFGEFARLNIIEEEIN